MSKRTQKAWAYHVCASRGLVSQLTSVFAFLRELDECLNTTDTRMCQLREHTCAQVFSEEVAGPFLGSEPSNELLSVKG